MNGTTEEKIAKIYESMVRTEERVNMIFDRLSKGESQFKELDERITALEMFSNVCKGAIAIISILFTFLSGLVTKLLWWR